jgi:ABC-type glycerol-3-phosphate transport system substrate-binding protein
VALLKYMQNPAENVKFAQAGGYLPARLSNRSVPYLRTEPWRTYAEPGKYALNRTAVTNAAHILSDLMQQVSAAELGQASPAQALQTAASETNSLL